MDKKLIRNEEEFEAYKKIMSDEVFEKVEKYPFVIVENLNYHPNGRDWYDFIYIYIDDFGIDTLRKIKIADLKDI